LLLVAVAGVFASVVLALGLAGIDRILAHNARAGDSTFDVADIFRERGVGARHFGRGLDISVLKVFEMDRKTRETGRVGRRTCAQILDATWLTR
jgi:hypothetical protein